MIGITTYVSGTKLSPLETDTAQAPYIIPQRVRGSRIEIARVYHSSRRSPDQL